MASSLSHPPTTLSSLLYKASKSITTPQKPFHSTSNFTSSKLIKHLLYNKNRVVKGLIPQASVDVIEDPILEEDVKEEKARALRVGIVCGGPSAERGLNSARSVLDHIQGDDIDVRCYYIDCDLNPFAISSAQMYSKTPVSRFDTIRMILAMAAPFSWEVLQLDVKSAFLHGELMEEVLVKQPEGFTKKGKEDKVYRLRKTIWP